MRLRVLVPVLVLVVLCAAVVVFAVVGPSTGRLRIPTQSMEPTLKMGAKVTVNRDAYGDGGRPRRGDIVVFHPPTGIARDECGSGTPARGQACDTPTDAPADILLAKRVVGLPGDRLALRHGLVVLDGRPQHEPYADDCRTAFACELPREITVPDGHYFVLGDNRGSSEDSRFFGPVKTEWIVGRIDDCSALHLHCSAVR